MRHDPPPLMLFAAGFGTRMRPLTDNCPKPLIQVAGRALIDHALDMARSAGITRIVANLHYLPDQIEAHLTGTKVVTVREEPEILETGGGLRNALPQLGSDTVLTLNTDAIWEGPNPITALLAQWSPDRMDALLTCVPVANTGGYTGTGDFSVATDGRLTRGPGYVYGGLQIMKTDRLRTLPDAAFSLNVVWNEMASDKRLFGCAYDGQWCDVGNPGGIVQAEMMMKKTDV
ncbi:MAG: nucleotidyltransferase family protein [Pseudomonadota bacterium]